MIKLKEAGHILLALILFAFVIGFLQDLNKFLESVVVGFVILFVNIFGKKLTASYYDLKIEHKIWHLQRYGWYKRSYFKKPLPMGLLLPFTAVWLSYPTGILKVLTFLQFNAKKTPARVAKRTGGLKRFSEITESNYSWIAGIGIFSLIILSGIAYLTGLTEIAKYSIYFCAWNLIPISQLDGTKIFFGNRLLWYILVIITIILLPFAVFM